MGMTENLVERFNSLTSREKTMLAATILLVVWGGWDMFIYQPLAIKHQRLTTELADLNKQLSAQKQLATEIEILGKTDPNRVNKQKLSDIKTDLERLRNKLDTGEKKFVPAHLMSEVLSDMLKHNNGLKLIQLKSLPVSTFPENSAADTWVYRHGLSITLSGNYLNTLKYLQSLEALPWRFNWDKIDYQVQDYPVGKTVLRINTLSFEENWLGL